MLASINWSVVVGSLTLVSVLVIGVIHAYKLRKMRREFSDRLNGVARGLDGVQQVMNEILSPAATVHGGRDSRVGPNRNPLVPSSAVRRQD